MKLKKRNKKGSAFFGIATFLIVFIFGILFLPFITNDIDTTRTALDCSNSSISDGAKLSCLFTDLTIPYLLWIIMALAVGFIVGART